MVKIWVPGALNGLVPPSSDLSGAAGTLKAAHLSWARLGRRNQRAWLPLPGQLLVGHATSSRCLFPLLQKEVNTHLRTPLSIGGSV